MHNEVELMETTNSNNKINLKAMACNTLKIITQKLLLISFWSLDNICDIHLAQSGFIQST